MFSIIGEAIIFVIIIFLSSEGNHICIHSATVFGNFIELRDNRSFHTFDICQLRTTVTKSMKLKQELATTRATLKTETEKCESIRECFEKLRQEMDTSEINLNTLISENLELRKWIEDTREWVQHNMNKENHERNNTTHFRDMHRSRELTNLKKKADEDFTTITQLRNK